MQKTISTLVGMLAAVGAFHAHAAGLQVNPTSLSLPAKQRAGIFTLGNTGSEPLTAQVRVYSWSQDEKGNEVLTPTDAVIASPPMVKLEAGAKQQFRVIRIRPSEKPVEEAYRLIVDELPAPQAKPRKGLQFVMRYSLPLFTNVQNNAEAKLYWRAEKTANGKTVLVAENSGTAHAQLSNINLQTASAKEPLTLAGGLAGYVLPGNIWKRELDVSPAVFSQGRLNATVNGGATQPEVRFATP